ncbi:lipoprotein [Spiroplasma tabanidicola]|uniref:Lipoprotein n=1 Tax=Spiroplasma tabanidicola TaxID=324079 RepID=A0A6I6C957_9MOLU|nr:lipoprotein [Spiroplasma tabanidicola]QGS51421.1 hypothetical protein STABA_v1c00540 [Spiroplasma tabanidicola]
MKKLLSLLGAIGMVATSSSVAVACNNGVNGTKQFGEQFKDTEVTVGTPVVLNLVAANKAKDAKISAKSADEKIAKVSVSAETDANGEGKFDLTITGVAKGQVVITVSYGDKSASLKATVKEATKPAFADTLKAEDAMVGVQTSIEVSILNGDSKTVLKAEGDDSKLNKEVTVVVDNTDKNKFTVTYTGKAEGEDGKLSLTYGELKKDLTVKVVSDARKALDTLLSGGALDLKSEAGAYSEAQAKEAALKIIKTKLGDSADPKETIDVVFSGFEASKSTSEDGKLVATASLSSKLIKGTVNFVLKQTS